MTGILILLGMNVILWKILVKLMFEKKLAGQPCPVMVSGTFKFGGVFISTFWISEKEKEKIL
jgi:hypothetical protein